MDKVKRKIVEQNESESRVRTVGYYLLILLFRATLVSLLVIVGLSFTAARDNPRITYLSPVLSLLIVIEIYSLSLFPSRFVGFESRLVNRLFASSKRSGDLYLSLFPRSSHIRKRNPVFTYLAEFEEKNKLSKPYDIDDPHLKTVLEIYINSRQANDAPQHLDIEKDIVVRMEPKSRQAVKLQIRSVKRAEPKVIYDPPDEV